MDPASFRRDPWLRTSGYHLVTWSLVAFVLELRRASGAESGAAFIVALLGGAVLTSLTHERRVGKMAGVAGTPLPPRIDVLWWSTAGAIVLASVALIWIRQPLWMYAMWMTLAGQAFLLWGIGVGFAWYRGLGVAMIAAGVIDVAMLALDAGTWLRFVVLGAGLPAVGLATSRRYLWFRPPRA